MQPFSALDWRTCVATVACLLLPMVSGAQTLVDPLVPDGASEWTLSAVGGPAVSVFHSVADRSLTLFPISWGRVVSGLHGSGILAGRLSMHLEAVPFVAVNQAETAYGAAITPIFLRWNFARHGRWAPFAEISGGFLRTDRPVPERTLRLNFTAHAGGGLRFRISETRALIVGYRFHHVSNGNRLEANPGVNSNLIVAGVSFFR